MIQKRLIIVLVTSVVMFGGLALVPKTPKMKPSRLSKGLPETFSAWTGEPQEPGEREKAILAKDTEFRRMSYRSADQARPPVETSLVFSGKNVNESIHRPEVCLRAQGWNFVSERTVEFEGLLPNGEVLPVRELVCRRPMMERGEEEGSVREVFNGDGEPIFHWRIFYYTFFGYEVIVSGHYERTIQDIKSRIVGGYDQRWAYATFSSPIVGRYAEQGVAVGVWEPMSLKKTSDHIRDFLKELLPLVVMPPREGTDPSLASNSKN